MSCRAWMGILALAWLARPAAIQAAAPPTAELRSFDDALSEIVRRSTAVASQQAALDAAQARAVPVKLRFVPDLSVLARSERKLYEGATTTGRDLVGVSQLNLFRF